MFDLNGNRPLRECMRLLEQRGTYVMVGGPKGDWTGPFFQLPRAKLVFLFSDKRDANFTVASDREDLEQLGEWLSSGKIRSVVEATYPLDGIAVPLDRQGEFHAQGKTVVIVEGSV